MKRLAVVLLMIAGSAALAAGPDASADPPSPEGMAEPNPNPLREQTIYVPYRKLWEVFETDSRGVFLPYPQFRVLWQRGLDAQPETVEIPSPIGARLAAVSGVARVIGDVVRFDADMAVELLEPGWHEVPLRLHDVAVTGALLDDDPARLLFSAKDGYRLLVEHRGDEAATRSLHLQFAKAFQKQAGFNEVSFQNPAVPVNQWDIRIDQPEAHVVALDPPLAATEVVEDHEEPAGTRVRAFVGAAPIVRFQWTPKQEGAKGLAALTELRTEQRVTILEGLVQTYARLVFTIRRAERSDLSFLVPGDVKVVSVLDPNVKEWTATPRDEAVVVQVQLFDPVKGEQPLQVALEKLGSEDTVSVPLVHGVAAGRQQGIVAVELGGGLRSEVAVRQGMLQMDREELPESLRSTTAVFAGRYLSAPFEVQLRVERLQPRIFVDSRVELDLASDDLTGSITSVFDIQRAGVFQLMLELPGQVEVREVHGGSAPDAAPARIERHYVQDDQGEGRRLVVELSAQAKGKTALTVAYARAGADAEGPAGSAAPAAVDMPLVRPAGPFLERAQGRVVIYAPDRLTVRPETSQGLRQISVADAASSGMTAAAASRSAQPVLAYRFGRDPIRLALAVTRRASDLTTRQLLAVSFEPGVARYQATFFHDVRFSGMDVLRFAAPADQAERIRVSTPGLRQVVESTHGQAVWLVTGPSEWMGQGVVQFTWEEPLKTAEIGEPVRVRVPRIMPLDTTRAWGQIVLTKAEGMDVFPAGRSGLRPIDPRYDLMPGAPAAEGAVALEFHDDWDLEVAATRYQPKDIKTTSIERGLVRVVMTRGKQTSVQAVYRMVSARQRLHIDLPDGVQFDAQPVRIDGRPVPLEQGEGRRLFIPLIDVEAGTPVALELRYLHPQKGWTVRGPEFPDEPAIQQVYVSVYLPEGRTFLGAAGPWDQEIVWRADGFNLTPTSRRSDAALLRWVLEGQAVQPDGLSVFPTSGLHLSFSALRPMEGKRGALRLIVAPAWGVQALVLGIIIAIGVGLRSAPWNRRASTIGGWLVGLIALSVFWPSLVRGLVSNAAVAAGLIVLIVWAMWFLLVQLPRSPLVEAAQVAMREQRNRSRQQTEAPPPMVPPPAADQPAARDEESRDEH